MEKRILCFGDSNTWGTIPGEPGRFPSHTRWTGVLQKELGQNYVVIEEGNGGRTSVHDDPVERRLSGLMKRLSPLTWMNSVGYVQIPMKQTVSCLPTGAVPVGSCVPFTARWKM